MIVYLFQFVSLQRFSPFLLPILKPRNGISALRPCGEDSSSCSRLSAWHDLTLSLSFCLDSSCQFGFPALDKDISLRHNDHFIIYKYTDSNAYVCMCVCMAICVCVSGNDNNSCHNSKHVHSLIFTLPIQVAAAAAAAAALIN